MVPLVRTYSTDINSAAAPQTPSRTAIVNKKIEVVIQKLSLDWDLNLRVPLATDSPSSLAPILSDLERKCIFQVKFLTFKDKIDVVLAQFEIEAKDLYTGWVQKSSNAREKLPRPSPSRPRYVLPRERDQLLNCFTRIADLHTQKLKTETQSRGSGTETRSTTAVEIDDSPIPFKYQTPSKPAKVITLEESLTTESRRSRETLEEEGSPLKKPRMPAARSANVATVPPPMLTSFESIATSFVSSQQSSIFDLSPNDVKWSQETVPNDIFEFDQQAYRDDKNLSSSYGSSINLADIQALPTGDDGDGALLNDVTLQVFSPSRLIPPTTTIEDLIATPRVTGVEEAGESAVLSQKIDEVHLEFDSGVSDDDIESLRERLMGIFPDHSSLCFSDYSVPFFFQYEIVRIFLHTGVPLSSLTYLPQHLGYSDYDLLWAHLKKLPCMAHKSFPPKVGKDVWAVAAQEVSVGSKGIIMNGRLQYCEKVEPKSGSIFQFHLRPLALDDTHRLQRRFGSDRFLEIDFPNIAGSSVPKNLQPLISKLKAALVIWLTDDHIIFGRTWKAFSNKILRTEAKKRKREQNPENAVANRIFFFAVDGDGFSDSIGTPAPRSTTNRNSRWTVSGLLNWLRPTWQNRAQPYLKLYARTPLGLSRNIATVVVKRSQIIYKPDIKETTIMPGGSIKEEVMTDGAGRICKAFARAIALQFGLDYIPSGFQARFGDAKGLWTIDPQEIGEEEWIEVYDSQRKWKRANPESLDPDYADSDPDYEDPAHVTFEVNSNTGPLKSAELNTQLLPIIIDRSVSKSQMKKTIEQIMVTGLIEDIQSQVEAMKDPKTCRKWIQESSRSNPEKARLGYIPYQAGLPAGQIEKMNLLLDSGFHPINQAFLRDKVQSLFTQKCDDLREWMKITVNRSAYVYMVPDFSGVLEPDEIFLHLSTDVSPKESLSTQSGLPMHGIEMLVARSPAHFASDVQKVKAVMKLELIGLKDVIIFSTKGVPSLAAKLSGGDYDGDRAWCCWEPAIVNNFENAKLPEELDLVKEGYIKKVSTSYEELVSDSPDPVLVFLRHAFAFNLEPSMLGICSTFKEDWAYDPKNSNTSSKIYLYLCHLLSNLVDQAKQGYIFTEDDFTRFRKNALGGAKRGRPAYKEKRIDPKSKHIIDRLNFVLDETIFGLLTDLDKSLPRSQYWDQDLCALYDWVKEEALQIPEWASILEKLKADISDVRNVWKKYYARGNRSKGSFDDTMPEFVPIRDRCFEMFCAITPEHDTLLTRTLLGTWHGIPELSQWALLRASVAFWQSRGTNFDFYMAGRQLCHLKALTVGMVPVTHEMYAMMKPDAAYVKKRMLAEDDLRGQFTLEDDGADEYAADDDYSDGIYVYD